VFSVSALVRSASMVDGRYWKDVKRDLSRNAKPRFVSESDHVASWIQLLYLP
jgi:hypothetical protein